jgi:integrase
MPPFDDIHPQPSVGTGVGPRVPRRLTAALVERARNGTLAPGRYRDRDGLILIVRNARAASWLLRVQARGRRHDVGLGSVRFVSLSQARDLARGRLAAIKVGGAAPVGAPAAGAPTLAEAALAYIASHQGAWRDRKLAGQWRRSLELHVFPTLGRRGVDTLVTADIVGVLKPLWVGKVQTGRKVQSRLERILAAAKVQGHVKGENVAAWRHHLDQLLPSPGKVRRTVHHPALAVENAPAVYLALARSRSLAAKAVRWTMLTVSRPTRAQLAAWDEIDERAGTWTVPGSRMKSGRLHITPLSRPARDILADVRGLDAEVLFPRVSRDAMRAALDKAGGKGATLHGCRAVFVSWAHRQRVPPLHIKLSLSHAAGNAVEQAYMRDALVAERLPTMAAWAAYLTGDIAKFGNKLKHWGVLSSVKAQRDFDKEYQASVAAEAGCAQDDIETCFFYLARTRDQQRYFLSRPGKLGQKGRPAGEKGRKQHSKGDHPKE